MKNSQGCTLSKWSNCRFGVGRVASSLFASLLFAAPAFAEYTCDLTFPSAPATPLANFPVLVRISETAPDGFLYTDCPTASCLWFTDESDDTLPFDVDTWNTSGTSLVWVSVPSLSSTAKITMHWDVGGAPSGQPVSTLVWSRANYVGVWHMNELVYDAVKEKHYTPDASASGWHAYKVTQSDAVPAPVTTAAGVTANPTPLTGTAMNIAYGAGKNNTSFGGFAVPMAQTSSFTLGGSGFTLSAIVNSQQIANNGRCRVIAFGAVYTEMANISVGSDDIYVMGGSNHKKPNPRGQTDWVYAAGVYGSPYSKIYADGVCLSGSNEGNPKLASLALTKGIGLGCFIDGKNTLDGYLDEARIRNVASTAEWIAAEYATVTDASYVSFGDVEGGGAEQLRIGTPTVSDITAVSATVSSRLTKFGEGATSASVSLHYTDGGAVTNTVALGSTNAVPAEFTAALVNLTPSTAYTVWFSAVNNAETPASTNSVAIAFSTGADATEWDTSTATFTPDGRTITAAVDITNVGSGSSTLYLMKGSGDTATVVGSAPVTSSGTKTVTGDFSDLPWGSRVYYSLMLVNGTELNAVTNTYNPGTYKYLQDNSTYTWVGGAAGVWTNSACWSRTPVGDLAATHPAGHPVYGSTARFITAEGDDPVTVTLPDVPGDSMETDGVCWRANTLNVSGMHEPLTFTSQTTNWSSRLYIHGVTAEYTYNRLVFDHAAAKFYAPRWMGAQAADENGENFTLTFTNGASGNLANWNWERPGVKLRVTDGSRVIAGAFSAGASASPGPVFEVDDAAFSVSGQYGIGPDTHGVNGMLIRLSGADASIAATYITVGRDNSTSNIVEFVIPAGGYTATPLNLTRKQLATDVFGGDGTTAPVTLKILRDSPGLRSISHRGIQLVQSVAGINASNLIFKDVKTGLNGFFFKDADGNEYADAAAISAAGKTADQITQIWYRPPVSPFVLTIR